MSLSGDAWARARNVIAVTRSARLGLKPIRLELCAHLPSEFLFALDIFSPRVPQPKGGLSNDFGTEIRSGLRHALPDRQGASLFFGLESIDVATQC
jgi:hypothetical protein